MIDAKRLDYLNEVVNLHYSRARGRAGLSFPQYLVLVRLHVSQGEHISYENLRRLVGIKDQSDFNRIVMNPLKQKKYAYTEKRKKTRTTDIFITENGSDLVERILKNQPVQNHA